MINRNPTAYMPMPTHVGYTVNLAMSFTEINLSDNIQIFKYYKNRNPNKSIMAYKLRPIN